MELPDIEGRRRETPAKQERNRLIVLYIKAGQTTAEVARVFGISKQRVSQIYNRERRRQ